MTNTGSKEMHPSVQRSYSNDASAATPSSSRISSVSDLSASTTPSAGLYDPAPSRAEFRVVSRIEGSEDSALPPPPSYDELDVSHIRISPGSGFPDEKPESTTERSAPILSQPPPSTSLRRNPNRFSWQSAGEYESLSPIERRVSQGRSLVGRLRSIRPAAQRRPSKHQTIPEEGNEMDVGLVNAAARFASGGSSYSQLDEGVEEEHLGVDISSFTGPFTPSYDEVEATAVESTAENRRLESEGQLTGGLGQGLAPDERISSRDLYASATPTTPIEGISRRFSRRGSGIARTPTLNQLGQREANKRGKIIEVVVEEPAEENVSTVDLTSLEGGHGAPSLDFNASNHGLKRSKPLTSIYYPQANWKPLSMRWPYLTILIVVSITLAAVQEYLYRRSHFLKSQDPPQGLYTFKNPQDIPTWDYFVFKYLPTILAVVYGILWQFTDFEVKRLEAYYQLSKEGGALAAESINVDYITVFNILRPFTAFRYKHWAVAFSSLATLLAVSLVPTLQTASIVLEPDLQKRLQDPLGDKFVTIDMTLSRSLTVVLSLIAACGCILLYQLERRRSGLVHDVKGIAGIAAMATKSHVLMDFKDLDTVSPKDIHNKLKDHRYSLENSSLVPDDAVPLSRAEKDRYDQSKFTSNPHPLMLRLSAGIPFIVGMILFLAFLPVVLFTPANVITDKTPWLLTALAVIIKIVFQVLEQDIRMMEPFYRLSCRHAPPKVLTLDYTSLAFGYMPVVAAYNGDYLVAFVGFGSVFAEVLTVCVTSFAGVTGAEFLPQRINNPTAYETFASGEETLVSFWVNFGLSLSIMLYLIIVAFFVLKLRRHPFLPRQPSTISSVLAFIHQSKMLYDFVSEESGDVRTIVRRLEIHGKTYGLGWFTGRDGETHCGIDEEELEHGYKHGVAGDVRWARKPWVGGWEAY